MRSKKSKTVEIAAKTQRKRFDDARSQGNGETLLALAEGMRLFCDLLESDIEASDADNLINAVALLYELHKELTEIVEGKRHEH